MSGITQESGPKAEHNLAFVDQLVEVLLWRLRNEVLAVLSRICERAIAIVRWQCLSLALLRHQLLDVHRSQYLLRVCQIILQDMDVKRD